MCNCPNPPGGGTQCNSDQIGTCIVVNGQCQGKCHTVPDDARNNEDAFTRFLMTVLTGQEYGQTFPPAEGVFRMFSSGEYVRSDGTVVNFSLPDFHPLQRFGVQ